MPQPRHMPPRPPVMTCTECALGGTRRYCAPNRCYCGHPTCHAYHSYYEPVAPAITTPRPNKHAATWANRKESTWIDDL